MTEFESDNQRIIEIEKGVSFGMASGAVIEITKRDSEPDAVALRPVSAYPWALWGKDNDQPQRIIDQNRAESTSAGALWFKIATHFGKGPYWYKESISPTGQEIKTPVLVRDLPADMQEFWFNNDIPSLLLDVITNYEWFNWYPMQYICNANYNKILWLRQKRTKDTRIGKRDALTGEIPAFYLSAKWPSVLRDFIAEVPAFSKEDPFGVANGIYKHQLADIDRDYYPSPYWQSNMRWMEVAMKIPRWINGNIDNSINIKYHVEIPEQYFIDLYPEKRYNSKEECYAARKDAEITIKQEIDKCLAGSDNAQKIFYTKFAIDPNTKQPLPGWKINELKNDIKDTAWLSADATAAARISSSHGVDPSLTALVTGSNLNVGSGSDAREKFNIHMQLKTVIPRQKSLEWFDIVSRANRWPEEYKIGYRDISIETLAAAKSGYTSTNEPNPTVK